jgi:hypothetical protein
MKFFLQIFSDLAGRGMSSEALPVNGNEDIEVSSVSSTIFILGL